MTDRAGYLYILTNPSLPGQIKVGRTSRNPNDRRKELSAATGVPTPFELVYFQHFSDCHAAEANAHEEWQRHGKRVNNGREFFRVTVDEATAVIKRLSLVEQKMSDPSVVADLLRRGKDHLFGSQSGLRDAGQALDCFEQAAAMGSIPGAYFAGRSAHRLAMDSVRATDTKDLAHRAMGHFQTAIDAGHANACAYASWIFRGNAQHQQADNAWELFLNRTDAGTPKGEALGWILTWADRLHQQGKPLDHPFLRKHKEALIAVPKDCPGVKQALARLGDPWWLRGLWKTQDWMIGLALRHPVSIVLLACALGLYVVQDGWTYALPIGAAAVAAWVEHRIASPKKRAPHPARRSKRWKANRGY